MYFIIPAREGAGLIPPLCELHTNCLLLQYIPICDCMQQSGESFSVNNDRLTSGKCRFMNGTGRGVVGLVSFPGSGNTWVRGLLQAVTGICTGTGVQVKSNAIIYTNTGAQLWV